MSTAQPQPWYREPWPWILMAGPAVVVVAGLVTAWLAFHGADGLAVDDYYKRGLAINKTLARSDAAERLGVHAELSLVDGRARVYLGDTAERGALTLNLTHPTRTGLDQSMDLAAIRPGVYEAQMQALQPGRWHVVLEGRDWRLTGVWILPAAGALTLGGRSTAPAGAGMSKEGKQ